jgi:DegV family protein with EDD domain
VAQVKIVTDSSAHLPDPNLIAELGIEVIPLTVRAGPQAYPERINQADEAFFRKLSQNGKNVSVETPPVSQVHALFGRLGQVTDSIVCIHASSALHDVAEVTRQASKSFMGRQRIIVLDTLTMSAGTGMIVEAAAKAAAAGEPQAEVVKIVRGMIPHMYALVFSDSLEYLEAWGRLGTAQTLLGTMLNLKPISTMEDGDLIPVEKVRNYARAVDKLYDFTIEFSRIEQLYLVQHGFETEAAQLLERLEVAFPRHDFPVIGYPPSLAVHIGPRALGVIVYEGTH